jgi:hypothetical protein
MVDHFPTACPRSVGPDAIRVDIYLYTAYKPYAEPFRLGLRFGQTVNRVMVGKSDCGNALGVSGTHQLGGCKVAVRGS